MIVDPVIILGAPRSGTSLLQSILRGHPDMWSMPSESDIVWQRHCHPRLRDWESEYMGPEHATTENVIDIRQRIDAYSWDAATMQRAERAGLMWNARRFPIARRLMRLAFEGVSRARGDVPKRIVEKTAANSLRVGFVDAVFPDAKYIHIQRFATDSIRSLARGWLTPNRFYSYTTPIPLDIGGYPHQGWNFVLPSGWREYVHSPLARVCEFQWRACEESIATELRRPQYRGRAMGIHLEDLVARPGKWLPIIAGFAGLPFDDYWQALAAGPLPVVNAGAPAPSGRRSPQY